MKAIVKNIVIIWKYKLATALKKNTPAVCIRTEAVDTEANAWPTCLLSAAVAPTQTQVLWRSMEFLGSCHLIWTVWTFCSSRRKDENQLCLTVEKVA